MGFKLGRTYRLVFEGGMAGAEVVFKATPVGVVMQVQGGLGIEPMSELIAEYVQEWNLETAAGEPLPVTAAAIRKHMEEAVMVKIVREWMKAARGVTAPLDGPSTSGEQSPAVELQMATL